MYRIRFKKEIVCEFLPPETKKSGNKVIILCDGMPSVPKKQKLAEFLSSKEYWVFYPRYRGAWESDGIFLQKSPHLDILDIVQELSETKEIVENSFYKKFKISAKEFFVIGGSFGGAVALLSSLDPRVKKVIANCPVVDWALLPEEEKTETANPNYVDYIKDTFGNAYRLPEKNWKKLYSGKFFNPSFYSEKMDPSKIRIFHAEDDPYIPYKIVQEFSQRTKISLKLFKKGGHLSTDSIVRKQWNTIHKFFIS
ncbi:alpha/beta hydrolase family protein [Leptospira sarikeiensis]|uniref:Peptidase S9 prolyl oligopeptidase catalytic domain-containing protein n=1 Tax=Leptospira sarikeiensis TaxID=2484943 RepID=A0A4R9KE18_9LEPT|nr:hypothetical protein [Leptospira sarikeiensis]TGL63432.1 hypothetical protein EHQ64_05605 [Leptospira sarikeiensis]